MISQDRNKCRTILEKLICVTIKETKTSAHRGFLFCLKRTVHGKIKTTFPALFMQVQWFYASDDGDFNKERTSLVQSLGTMFHL